MDLRFEEERPIFIQLAEQLEDGILAEFFRGKEPLDDRNFGTLQDESRTALKGINPR